MNPARPPRRSKDSADVTTFVSIRYEPIAEIGAGGMGTVSLARALSGPSAGEFVAIKRLFPHLEKDRQVADAFLDEVYLIAALHHPNVVEPTDWGKDDFGSYLAMQFVPGDSLRALVCAREASQEPLPIAVVAEIIAAAAEGLHAAHELRDERGTPLQLVHRDVSPANILIGYDGTVKLIDFGVAKVHGKVGRTESGMIKGKFGYMSPEQVRGNPLDRRSDVFSLGVCAWEALTLCRLYSAARDFDVMRMICEEEPVAPSELRGDVPPELDRVVLRCLAKSRDARYATCADLARDLRALRLAPADAPRAVAEVARASMPERLRWIEEVTGVPVRLAPPRAAVTPDATVRAAAVVAARAAEADEFNSAPTAVTRTKAPIAPRADVFDAPPTLVQGTPRRPGVAVGGETTAIVSPPQQQPGVAREDAGPTVQVPPVFDDAVPTPLMPMPVVPAPPIQPAPVPFAPPPAPSPPPHSTSPASRAGAQRFVVPAVALGVIAIVATLLGAWLGGR